MLHTQTLFKRKVSCSSIFDKTLQEVINSMQCIQQYFEHTLIKLKYPTHNFCVVTITCMACDYHTSDNSKLNQIKYLSILTGVQVF